MNPQCEASYTLKPKHACINIIYGLGPIGFVRFRDFRAKGFTGLGHGGLGFPSKPTLPKHSFALRQGSLGLRGLTTRVGVKLKFVRAL